MAKDPAVLFYTKDFLTGCSDLDMEERGQYVTLLCIQHQKGELTEKTIRLNVGSVSVSVLEKFEKLKNGNYLNVRMAEEMDKRANFLESRRLNGMKGGRPKASGKPNGKANAKPNGKARNNLPVNGDVNVNNSIVYPFSKKFLTKWVEWKQYKYEQYNFIYKPTSEKAALTNLCKLANHEKKAISVIDQSMANGWKGFHDIKQSETHKSAAYKPLN